VDQVEELQPILLVRAEQEFLTAEVVLRLVVQEE
jgi:hypothetical protein